MAAGWFDGLLVDAESCDLLVAAGCRDAVVAFLASSAPSEGSRVLARQVLAGIDRGARAFAAARSQVAHGADGAESERMVTRSEAAGVLGRTPQRVSGLVRERRLQGRIENGRLMIDRASLDAELARRRNAA